MYDVKSYIEKERKSLRDKFDDLRNKIHHNGNDEILSYYTNLNIIFESNSKDDSLYMVSILKDCDYFGLKSTIIDYSLSPIPTNPFIPTIVICSKNNDHNEIFYRYRYEGTADVEGATSRSVYQPIVASGIIDFLNSQNYSVEDKNVLIIGRGPTMGSRLMRGFISSNANVTIAHSKTSEQKLYDFMSESDIVITATNVAHQFNCQNTPSNHRSDLIFIDAGTCFDENGRVCGNCCPDIYDHYLSMKSPGGVGPLTRLRLFKNIYETMSKNYNCSNI